MNASTCFQNNVQKCYDLLINAYLETQITIQTTFVEVKSLYKFLFIKLSVCRCCEISVQYNTRKIIDGMVRLIVMYDHRQTFVVVSNIYIYICMHIIHVMYMYIYIYQSFTNIYI